MNRRRNKLYRAMSIVIALLGACPVSAAAVELSVYAPGGSDPRCRPQRPSEIPYAAVVLKSTKIPEVAGAFVQYLVAPPGRAAFKAAGFEPPPER
jgi:ABC-type molybdate transport system substrate-binding protein